MQQLKALLLTAFVGSAALFMFFVGLGLTLFIFVVLAVTRLFMKPQSHEQLKTKWQQRYHNRNRTTTQTAANHTVIEGQYTVVDNQ